MRNGTLLIVFLTTVSLFAQPGSLDPTFNCILYRSEVYSMVNLPDDKILVDGTFQVDANSPIQHLIRLNSDGSFDFSFSAAIDSLYGFCHRQSDGKIIVTTEYEVTVPYDTIFAPDSITGIGFDTFLVTYTTLRDSLTHFHRLNVDGDVDSTYHITLIRRDVLNHSIASIIQPDGKLILCSNNYNDNSAARDSFRFMEDATRWYNSVRLNIDGSVDATFHPILPFLNSFVKFQSDGKMIIRQYGNNIPSLHRLNVDGSIDLTYQSVNLPANFGMGRMFFQPDGKILMVADFFLSDSVLVRLNADGSIDSTFHVSYLIGTSGASSFSTISDIKTQADGKIVIAGDFDVYNGSSHKAVVRLNPDGSVDESFNNYDFSANTRFWNLSIQSTGKILVSGYKYIPDNLIYLPIYRLNVDTGALICAAYFRIYPDSTAHNWIALNLSPSINPLTYTWYWGDGDSSVGATPSHTYSSAGHPNICLHVSDGLGCEDWYCDSSIYVFKTEEIITVNVVDGISSISETNSEGAIAIFPNPSQGIFTLTSDISQGGGVSVYAITGAKVFASEVASLNRTIIDILQQPKGIYIVKVNNSRGVWTQRVVVE